MDPTPPPLPFLGRLGQHRSSKPLQGDFNLHLLPEPLLCLPDSYRPTCPESPTKVCQAPQSQHIQTHPLLSSRLLFPSALGSSLSSGPETHFFLQLTPSVRSSVLQALNAIHGLGPPPPDLSPGSCHPRNISTCNRSGTAILKCPQLNACCLPAPTSPTLFSQTSSPGLLANPSCPLLGSPQLLDGAASNLVPNPSAHLRGSTFKTTAHDL